MTTKTETPAALAAFLASLARDAEDAAAEGAADLAADRLLRAWDHLAAAAGLPANDDAAFVRESLALFLRGSR